MPVEMRGQITVAAAVAMIITAVLATGLTLYLLAMHYSRVKIHETVCIQYDYAYSNGYTYVAVSNICSHPVHVQADCYTYNPEWNWGGVVKNTVIVYPGETKLVAFNQECRKVVLDAWR